MAPDLTSTEGIILLKTEGCNRCAAVAKRFSDMNVIFETRLLEDVDVIDVADQLLKMGATQPGMMPVVVVDGAIAIDGAKFFRADGFPVVDPMKVIEDERSNPFKAS